MFLKLVVASLAAALTSCVFFGESLSIGIYYESRCPSCQEYIQKQVLPLANFSKELLLAGVSVHPVPYGNAKETLSETGHFEYECQNGPEECYLNRVEACGLTFMAETDIDVWAPWISCVNQSSIDMKSLRSAEEHLLKAAAASRLAVSEAERAAAAARAAAKAAADGRAGTAAQEVAVAAEAAAKAAADASFSSIEVTRAAAAAAAGGNKSWVTCPLSVSANASKLLMIHILVCSLSPMGEKIQHLMSEQTPVHEHVPWVTLDKQHVPLAETDLRCAICQSPVGSNSALESMCSGLDGCETHSSRHALKDAAAPEASTDDGGSLASGDSSFFPVDKIKEM